MMMMVSSRIGTLLLLLLLFFLATVPAADAQKKKKKKKKTAATDKWKPVVLNEETSSQSHLFEPSAQIQVSSPSHFPKPTRKIISEHDNNNVTVIIEPTFGQHRPEVDAVLAYAEGYQLSYYMMFLETLRETGFRGDVVLAIAEERIIKEDVVDYLKTYAAQGDTADKPGLVVYQVPLDCDGGPDGSNKRRLTPHGETDIFQMCRLSNIYGWKDNEGKVIRTAPDPREGRVVATLRYEWYWIWSLRYKPHSWLMLIDARDSYFQSNPFANLPRDNNNNDNKNSPDGLLYFFGENANATRLGKSTKNLKWIRNGYGEATLTALANKPTICSGSTMGEQIAIETYLRALINEHDEGQVRMTGSDQGFHNYLYYSRKLVNAKTIRKIIVWEQGRGIINNLGALRTQPLAEWGMYNEATHEIFQWDGTTLSPVVHQWDRDKHLHHWMWAQKHSEWREQWQKKKNKKKKK